MADELGPVTNRAWRAAGAIRGHLLVSLAIVTTNRNGLLLVVLLAFFAVSARSAFSQTLSAGGYAVPDSVTLHAGDILEVHVWPDSSYGGRFPIEQSGNVQLPLVGPITVGGRSLGEVRTELRTRYAKLLEGPIVMVKPLFRVSVLGAVFRPVVVDVDPSYTIFDMIGIAGGFRPDAKESDIRVVRNNQSIELKTLFPKGGEDAMLTLPVQSGDRIVVPEEKLHLDVRDVLFVMQSIAIVFSLARK